MLSALSVLAVLLLLLLPVVVPVLLGAGEPVAMQP